VVGCKNLEEVKHEYGKKSCGRYIGFREFFLFFTFFFPLFCKNIWSAKKLQNYTSGAVGDGVRDLMSCPTAVGDARYCSTSCRCGPRR
jgi:hypothetical protein